MRDDQIKKLENEMNKLKSDYDEKTNKNKKLTTQLTQIKAAYKSKLKEHEHVSQQLQNKIESLKEKCGESIGALGGLVKADFTQSTCFRKIQK